MSISKTMRISAMLLAVLLVFLSGCTATKKQEAKKSAADVPWAVTEYNMDEIVNEKGEFIIDKLKPATVAELKDVDGKQVIYHLGQPYLFHAMHLRIDHLLSAGIDDATIKRTFDEGMRLIKAAGYDTVILYFSWDRFFDGSRYDFTELEYQYSVAKKYDMKIMWNWYGYDVCGFGGYRTWQYKNQDKYPPLKDEDGNVIYSTSKYNTGELAGTLKPIPDLSVQSFIDIEVEAIKQFCAWLNVYDVERRSIGIQIENEPNHTEGGHGLWFSQYEALAHLLDELGRAVKEGPYSMITYLNLMSEGWDQVDENGERTVFKKQVMGLIEKEHIDIVGYDFYSPTTSKSALTMSVVEQGDNPHLMVEFGPCVWCVPAQTNILLSMGYGIGYYHTLGYKDVNQQTAGFFRYGSVSEPYVFRDGTNKVYGYFEGQLEVVSQDFILMNNSIKAISQIIAVAPNANMTFFNNNMVNNFNETKTLGNKTFTFTTSILNDRYGSTALLIKEDDDTYYTYAHKSATLTVDGGIKSASEGVYKDGKWIKTKDVEIIDGTLTYEPGKAYRFTLN